MDAVRVRRVCVRCRRKRVGLNTSSSHAFNDTKDAYADGIFNAQQPLPIAR
jgi:hypothetical protein